MGLLVAVDLVVCGVVFPILTLIARRLQPDLHGAALLAGFVGGGLCAAWGFMGRQGMRCRSAAVVTLAISACVFAWHALRLLHASGVGESQGRMATALMAMLTVFSVGMVVNLIQDSRSHEA